MAYNQKDREIIVAFRGSQNVENWVTNLDFVKTNYPAAKGAEVHEGFYKAYQGVQTQILQAVRNALALDRQAAFFVTGHSLGGALATLAALDLKSTFPTAKMTMYTYGCPRVGN